MKIQSMNHSIIFTFDKAKDVDIGSGLDSESCQAKVKTLKTFLTKGMRKSSVETMPIFAVHRLRLQPGTRPIIKVCQPFSHCNV